MRYWLVERRRALAAPPALPALQLSWLLPCDGSFNLRLCLIQRFLRRQRRHWRSSVIASPHAFQTEFISGMLGIGSAVAPAATKACRSLSSIFCGDRSQADTRGSCSIEGLHRLVGGHELLQEGLGQQLVLAEGVDHQALHAQETAGRAACRRGWAQRRRARRLRGSQLSAHGPLMIMAASPFWNADSSKPASMLEPRSSRPWSYMLFSQSNAATVPSLFRPISLAL